jgi:opacity protein-like surface antigen
MKKAVLGAVFFAAMVVWALAPVSASAAGSGLYVVGKAGALFPNHGDTGFSGDVGFGYDLVSGDGLFGVEATVGYQGVSNTSGGLESTLDNVPFAITLKAGAKIIDKIRIYGGAGVDIAWVSWDLKATSDSGFIGHNHTEDAVFGAHVLCGATYDITNRIYLGVEGKYLWANEAKMTMPAVGGKVAAVRGNINNFSTMAVVGFRF